MKTIKEIISNIDVDGGNISDIELKCVSLKEYYGELKKQGRLRDMIRLRYIMYYYPDTMLKNISFKSLKLCVESPEMVSVIISSDRDWLHPFEVYATKKSGKSRTFMMKYFYEYFKI